MVVKLEHDIQEWTITEYEVFLKSLFPVELNIDFVAPIIMENIIRVGGELGQLFEFLMTLIQRRPGECIADSSSVEEIYEKIKIVIDNIKNSISTYSKEEGRYNPFWPDDAAFKKNKIYPTIHTPKIISKGQTSIATAGSCFAEEISKALQKEEYNFLITEQRHNGQHGILNTNAHKAEEVASTAQWGILFNTPSFSQLLERAFGLRQFPKILLRDHKQSTSGLTDPYRENIVFVSKEIYELDYERHLDAVRKAVLFADVFIITPGLNECWEFLGDGTVFSRNPRHDVLKAISRPKTLTVSENIHHLQKFIDIARRYNPELKIIISLSPIPFLATTRKKEMHVFEANTLSKSVLRVAIDEVVRANEDVYYFPSYEYVTVSVDDPWEDDRRHVKREVVEEIIEFFEYMFVKN